LHIVYQLFKMRHNEIIVENRTHQELVALPGRYYRLVQTKLK
jgi:ABC-type multidrug transport system fused ATPase/permease subunit